MKEIHWLLHKLKAIALLLLFLVIVALDLALGDSATLRQSCREVWQEWLSLYWRQKT